MDEPVAQLAWPMATAATGGAAIAASVTRWWLLGPYHGPVAIFLAASIGAWLGAMLTYSLRADDLRVTRGKAVAATALSGPGAAIAVVALFEPSTSGAGAAVLGLALGLVLLPCVTIGVAAARAASRSRVRSLVGGSDRRAAWRAAAVWLAAIALVGSVPGVLGATGRLSDVFWWGAEDRVRLSRVPLSVALAAYAIAAIVALLDARARALVLRACRARAHRSLEARGDVGGALDVGIGNEAWMEHVAGHATYRASALERVAAIGDLGAGAELLGGALRRSTRALAFALIAAVATLGASSMVVG